MSEEPPTRSSRSASSDNEAMQVERWSRALADTMIDALLGVQATTSPTQVRALLALEALGGCSNAELARELSIFPSSATRLTDRLIAAGLVQRDPSQWNRREVRLVLTPAGRRSLERFVAARVAVIARVLARMRAADRVALRRGLEAFHEAAGHAAQEKGPGR